MRLYRARGGSKAQSLRFLAFVARARNDLSGAIGKERAALASDPSIPYVADWLVKEYHLLGLPREALAIGQGRLGGNYRPMWLAGERRELRRRIRSAPRSVLAAPDSGEALFALGAMRDWATLTQLHGLREPTSGDLCQLHGVLLPQIIIALRETGQVPESRRLIDCMRRRVDSELSMTMRSPDGEPGRTQMRKASLLALTGDRTAIEWLDRAITRGWLGQYYSSKLADWPQFDALRDDPRLAKLQQRIDATIARERAEVVRDLGAVAR